MIVEVVCQPATDHPEIEVIFEDESLTSRGGWRAELSAAATKIIKEAFGAKAGIGQNSVLAAAPNDESRALLTDG